MTIVHQVVATVAVMLISASSVEAAHNRREKEGELRERYKERITFGGQYNAIQLIPVALDEFINGGTLTQEWVKDEATKALIEGAKFLVEQKFNPATEELIGGVMTFRIWQWRKDLGYNVFVPYIAIRLKNQNPPPGRGEIKDPVEPEVIALVKQNGIDILDDTPASKRIAAAGGLFMVKDENQIFQRNSNGWREVDRSPEVKTIVCAENKVYFTKGGNQVFRWEDGKLDTLDGSDGNKQLAVDPDTRRLFMVKKDTEVHEIGVAGFLDTSEERKVIYAGGGNLFMVKAGIKDGGQVWVWKGSKLFDGVGPHTAWVEIDARGETRELAIDEDKVYMLKGGKQVWRWKGLGKGWEGIDDSPEFKHITAAGGNLYMLKDNGQVWRWKGTPMQWELYHSDPKLRSIVASGDKLYGTLLK
ncbi:MAG: peptidase [Gemmataceae bacterium]|nr:peptidase [Gemmataceae bacterium]